MTQDAWGELRALVHAQQADASWIQRRQALWEGVAYLDMLSGDERDAARRYLFEALDATTCRDCGGRARHPTTCMCLGGGGMIAHDAMTLQRLRGSGFHEKSELQWSRSLRQQLHHALTRQAMEATLSWKPYSEGYVASPPARHPLGAYPPPLPKDYMLKVEIARTSDWDGGRDMTASAWIDMALAERFFERLLVGWVVRHAHGFVGTHVRVHYHRMGA